MFELCEDLLDGIEVGTVWRQEEELCPDLSNGAAHGLSLVGTEIVEDDDIAWLEGGDQELLDIGEELLAVDGAIEEARRIDAVVAQGGQEGECTPSAMRGAADQALAAWPPASQRRHIGLGPSLVDEDQAFGVDAGLARLPLAPPPRHVGTLLFSGEGGFF